MPGNDVIYPELLAKKANLEKRLNSENKSFIIKTDWFGKDSVTNLKSYINYLEDLSSKQTVYSGNIKQFKGSNY